MAAIKWLPFPFSTALQHSIPSSQLTQNAHLWIISGPLCIGFAFCGGQVVMV